MKKYIKIIVPITIVFVVLTAIVTYTIHWAFFDIQRIEGQEILREISSPNEQYTITVYLNNGGATTDYAVLCTVTDNET